MVIPSYWGRRKEEGRKEGDIIYDHPTPLDEEGTLLRLLRSLAILENRDFSLVIIGAATSREIIQEVEQKLRAVIKKAPRVVSTFLFSYSHLEKIYRYLEKEGKKDFIPLLSLDGYSNVRNLCLFLPHLLGSEVAVLVDDDEIFEDPGFMDKALEFIAGRKKGQKVLAVAGFYLNPDNDFLLKRETQPWMTYWNKIDCMNRAFKEIIGLEPRLKVTPFAFGGNLVIHRDLFTRIPFDPSITRGEDIDFLINARMFGFNIYLDNQLAIEHEAPPKTSPTWERVREDIFRFVYEREKLKTQEPREEMSVVKAEELNPYPGEFLKDDLEQKIFRSNLMLALDYLLKGEFEGASECMNNIYLARTKAIPSFNPFLHLIQLQKDWEKLMEFFSSARVARRAIECCCLLKEKP